MNAHYCFTYIEIGYHKVFAFNAISTFMCYLTPK